MGTVCKSRHHAEAFNYMHFAADNAKHAEPVTRSVLGSNNNEDMITTYK